MGFYARFDERNAGRLFVLYMEYTEHAYIHVWGALLIRVACLVVVRWNTSGQLHA